MGTDCTGNFKFRYHTIKITTTPICKQKMILKLILNKTTRIITSAFDLVLLWLWTIITGLLHLKFSSTKYTTICRFWFITWPFFCFISLTIVRYKTLCPTCPITKASIYDWNKWNNFRLIKWKQYWLIREYYKCVLQQWLVCWHQTKD